MKKPTKYNSTLQDERKQRERERGLWNILQNLDDTRVVLGIAKRIKN